MEKLYEIEPLNPINLEKEVGLNPGDILSITTYPEGAVIVNYRSTPSSIIETQVKAELVKRGLPRGKKPE